MLRLLTKRSTASPTSTGALTLNERPRRTGSADSYTDDKSVLPNTLCRRVAAAIADWKSRFPAQRDSTAPGPPRSPKGPIWADQLQQELVATAESMRAAQMQLAQERQLRMVALKNEERAQLEARLARRTAIETTKEQQEAERKMLISANGMRTQREHLQGELMRLAEQQSQLELELQAQRQRAALAEREAQQAIEEAQLALERKEHEFEMREKLFEEERRSISGRRVQWRMSSSQRKLR